MLDPKNIIIALVSCAFLAITFVAMAILFIVVAIFFGGDISQYKFTA